MVKLKSGYLAGRYCRGLTGLPLRLISKCSRGLRSGPSPMVAIRWPFFIVEPSLTSSDALYP